MPIYEYRCDGCDASFETLVRAGHPDDARCPSCDGARLRRVMSVFAARGGTGDGAAEASRAIASNRSAVSGGCCGGACGCR
jgi:putative FmdB family regulatory protein